MDMYLRYKSKFGYQNGNNQIDSYGVDHSGFTTQDEVAYQFAREEKENALSYLSDDLKAVVHRFYERQNRF